MSYKLFKDDCLRIVGGMEGTSVDLVYLDPPFFSQRVQRLKNKDRSKEFSFADVWQSMEAYAGFLHERLIELHRVLKPSGSIFFHCDRKASHIARLILDEVFGRDMFRSEIIWHYRRWSRAQRKLLPSHQNIYLYTKSGSFKFNEILEDYSPATNTDQIRQKRARDAHGKIVYAKDENGGIIPNGCRSGVPLGDVWDIPYLNPKAKERTGYPTQKPVLLLERIISLCTDEGDLVLDPFCGSGAALVAAELMKRDSIGIDISEEAIDLTRARLGNPTKTESALLAVGRNAYRKVDEDALQYLKGLELTPVHRSSGIDAILNAPNKDVFIPIRVQKPGESLLEAASALSKASRGKHPFMMVLVATSCGAQSDGCVPSIEGMVIVDSASKAISSAVNDLLKKQLIRI